jgi:two-component system C4-dicarboxylate transport response regulator DctD
VHTAALELLIVDDDLETRELLAEFCRTLGFGVATSRDGRAAIAAVERDPLQYGVVLTDINMPGADGFEVLRRVRAANPSCYVVMITGYATLDSAVRAVKEGAYDFLAKPFAFGQLEIVLSRVRDRMALECENRDLARQVMQTRPGTAGRSDYGWRLDAIEQRLADIERAIRALGDRHT